MPVGGFPPLKLRWHSKNFSPGGEGKNLKGERKKGMLIRVAMKNHIEAWMAQLRNDRGLEFS